MQHYTDEAKVAFGEFIKEQRRLYSERHGRTYYPYQIVELTGVSQPAYYAIEKGMVFDGFRAVDLLRLARFYGFSLEDAAAVLGFPPKE